MRRILPLLLALAASMSASEALACSVHRPIHERITDGYGDAVVLAVIRHAEYGMPHVEGGNERPWKGTAEVHRTLEGKTDERIFHLYRSGSSTACDDGISAPRPGSIWVLYVSNDAPRTPEGYREALGYPLAIAHGADPRLPRLLERAGYGNPGRNE